jgi:Ca-activated chloride channel family protein
MAVTPRYIPGSAAISVTGTGWSPDSDRVDDASRITPPVVHPSLGKLNPVVINVALDAGFRLAKLESPYHAVKIVETADHRYTVALDDPVPADRDFELVWTPEVGRAPGAAVFSERTGDTSHVLLMLVPGVGDASAARTPREVTFIVDTSGSMSGSSIVQAKAALLLALERLSPGDRFNVIEFNSRARALFASPVPVDPATIGRARSFVSGLRADGGTEMREALMLALKPDRVDGFVRQVVFLTDGAVGNEEELFALIRSRLADRRLFTVGIGSAPNSHFMTKAAQFGRGTFTYIGDVREVQQKMGALFRKLETPLLTDIELAWPGSHETYPATVPDLYAGEPIVVSTALRFVDGDLVVRGRYAGKPWQATLPLAGNGEASGVSALWARAKIDALADAKIAGANADDIRAEIVRVALAHHLVSQYTSLVAVDVTPTAPPGIDVKTAAVPGNLPDGQEFEKIFGGLPQTATPAARDIAIAVAALLVALLLWSYGRGGARAGAGAGVLLLATLALHAPQANARDDAMLLVPGHYDGDVGSFDLGAVDRTLDTLPADKWFVLDARGAKTTLSRASMQGTRPKFLDALERMTADSVAELEQRIYWLRVPDIALAEGQVSEAAPGRKALVPKLGHRYALTLDERAFALTARNGRGGRDGALYTIEVDGASYDYLMPGEGFQHEIVFAGDIDRDTRPDFIVYVSAKSAGAYHLLLSSKARPGLNAPTAALWHTGY